LFFQCKVTCYTDIKIVESYLPGYNAMQPVEVSQHLGGTCLAFYLLHAGSLLGLFFNPEDGGGMILRNVG
jgi:hypothetical protein